jgi:aryl-alcohol dehydrogenase-like predicted oxidoreductase
MVRLSRRKLMMGGLSTIVIMPSVVFLNKALSSQAPHSDANAPAGLAGTITLGKDLTVNRLGFGASRLGSWQKRPKFLGLWSRDGWQDPSEAAKVLRRAVELGVQFIDTADIYGRHYGACEELIRDALYPYPRDLVIATKGGLLHAANGDGFIKDGTPAHLQRACETSLQRLRVPHIDLYQLHWVDPKVPLEDSMEQLARLRSAGKIRNIGLCNVTLAELRRAENIAPVASVQNRYNVNDRSSEDVLKYCERTGIVFTPWAPLGGDQPAAGAQSASNQSVASAQSASKRLSELAAHRGVSLHQLELAWLLARSPQMLLIPGTSSVDHLEQNISAARVTLTAAELASIG